ncbi:MAG: gamma-glutamyltransferase [Bdellovibrionales bacterium]|nr:gamma-glutamyltransferase [Bdellovibrionales bacterium]
MRLLHAVFPVLALISWTTANAMPTSGHKLMISAPSPYAVEVGRKVAARGGNVMDVAVAVGLTLSVTSPYFAALGGGGFALVKMKEGVQALDFRETAPAATSKDYYLKLDKEASQTGGHAVGVPGFPAGLWALHQKYGKLKWADLFREAELLAKNGFAVSGEWTLKTDGERERFNKAGILAFVRPGGVAYKPGEVLRQPLLGKALAEFRTKNLKGFYEGAVAADVVQAVQEAGGKMTLTDLKAYKVRWLEPLTTQYDGHKVYLMPPPSSGGVLILSALRLIEKLGVKDTAALSVDEFHLLGEIEARVFRGRALLGDPDFHKNPMAFLTSDSYIDGLSKTVKNKAVALAPLKPEEIKESAQTTHYSVMDAEGHAVALTVTLNGNYGSGVVTPRYHIALNNEMDDFTTRPGESNMYGLVQGPGNEVEPGKRPLSSMSPTLVEKDGKIVMAIGAPGGPRIITSVLQALYRIIGRGIDPDMAVQAPRVHHQFLPNVLFVDRGRFSPEVIEGLKARGHRIQEGWMGKVYVVRLRPDGILDAAFDSRGEGAAGGI